MIRKHKLQYLILTFAALLSSGCNAANSEIKPYFNADNQSGAFFDNPAVLASASDFSAINKKVWDYPSELKHKQQGKKTVSNCLALKQHMSEGYTAAKVSEHVFINAQLVLCSMWQQMSNFKSYNASFMKDMKLDKMFADLAPARFALLISNDDIKKAEAATSWNSVSKIKEVKSHNDQQATFYDHSGSIQRLTLMARGDYNADGIEDQLFYMENSVEGGSYSSAKAYIITRIKVDGPITLLNEI